MRCGRGSWIGDGSRENRCVVYEAIVFVLCVIRVKLVLGTAQTLSTRLHAVGIRRAIVQAGYQTFLIYEMLVLLTLERLKVNGTYIP